MQVPKHNRPAPWRDVERDLQSGPVAGRPAVENHPPDEFEGFYQRHGTAPHVARKADRGDLHPKVDALRVVASWVVAHGWPGAGVSPSFRLRARRISVPMM